MAIIAPTFDFMKVGPGDDAHLYDFLSFGGGIDPNYGTMFSAESSGLTVTVKSGMAIIKGRMVKNTDNVYVTVPANSKGYIAITIDLTKTNTFTGTPGDDNYKPVNNQVRIERVASLTQQDLLDGGSIYMFPICEYTSTGSTVTLGPRLYESGSRKSGSVVLFSGLAGYNETINLPSNTHQFKVLTVSFYMSGSTCTITTLRDDSTGIFQNKAASNMALYNGATDKGWETAEAEVTFTRSTAKITRAKILRSSGSVVDGTGVGDNIKIVSIIGSY